jgi:hypothetical protein
MRSTLFAVRAGWTGSWLFDNQLFDKDASPESKDLSALSGRLALFSLSPLFSALTKVCQNKGL